MIIALDRQHNNIINVDETEAIIKKHVHLVFNDEVW